MQLSRIIDLASIGILVLTFVLKIVGLEYPALLFGMVLPGAGGVFCIIALVDGMRRGIKWYDLVMPVMLLVVGVLALPNLPPPKETWPANYQYPNAYLAAIALGAFVPTVAGVVMTIVAVVNAVIKRARSTGKDFSSFSAEEERAFAGQEQRMVTAERKAVTVGFGIAGAAFVIGAVIVASFYTPCSKYCERPPSCCKTEAEAARFKQVCEDACGKIRKAKGDESIVQLTGCAFSNATSGSCEAITKEATTVGLWCESKN